MTLCKSLRLTLLLFFLLGCSALSWARNFPDYCNDAQLKTCADNAEPLLKDPNLIVPDSERAVSEVCRIWGEFTNCINSYTKRCMTPEQRIQFERTFKQPVASMSNLCQNPNKIKEYLNYAPCVKMISTENRYCGNQYRFLIDLVAGSTFFNKQICCAKVKLKECIMKEAPNACSSPSPTVKNSTAVAVSILDKSLAFISQRCDSISFNQGECPGIRSYEERASNTRPLSGSGSGTQYISGRKKPAAASGSEFQLDEAPKGTKKLSSPGVNKISLNKETPQKDKLSSEQSNKAINPGKGSAGNLSRYEWHSYLYFTLLLTNLVAVLTG